MKKITTTHCKVLLTHQFYGTKTSEWKLIHKSVNAQGQIVRQYNHLEEGMVELTEIGNRLAISDRKVERQKTWQEYLNKHFENPVYKEENYTLKDKLDIYLATVEHGRQHNEGSVKFVIHNGEKCLQTELDENLFISLQDLEKFGYSVTQGQSADDFLSSYWCWY